MLRRRLGEEIAPRRSLASGSIPDNSEPGAPPEVAFPQPQLSQGVILSGGGAPLATPESKDPFISVNGSVFLAGTERTPLIPEVPPLSARDYAAEAEAAMSETTPEDIELNEILKTQGI